MLNSGLGLASLQIVSGALYANSISHKYEYNYIQAFIKHLLMLLNHILQDHMVAYY